MDSPTTTTRGGPSNPAPGKGARLARSRAACTNCHRAKHFGIECVFPSSAGPVTSRTTLGGSAPKANGKAKETNGAAAPAARSPSVAATPDLAETLRMMTNRLSSIEETLAKAQLSFPSKSSSHSDQLAHTSSPHPPSLQPEFALSRSNPVETAGEAMAVEGLVDLGAPSGSTNAIGGVESWGTMIRPDVLDRGIMSVTDVEAEFEIYFRHIHPWMALLSNRLDRQPLVIRERCPLLFHSILILTTYYRPRTSSNILLYRAISSILDSILAPIILCAQPDQLSTDLVRALYLLLLYKPVQYASMAVRGVTDPSVVEHASKMNVRASYMLRTLCVRVATYISLPSITNTFARAFANRHIMEIPDDVVNDQRLYFSCIWHSMHGGLQSGSRVDFVPQDALKTTRLFSLMRQQPSDVRLAASVELAAAAATLLHTRKENDTVEQSDLNKFNEDMEEWEAFWIPELAKQEDDDLRFSTQFVYTPFVKVVINGFAFTRWKAEKKEFGRASLMGQGEGMAPKLSEGDHDSIRRAVEAAEGMMLAVTVEGKDCVLKTGKKLEWGTQTQLTLDSEWVQKLRWASDSLTCVVYSYSLILLAKLANEGLLTSSLQLLPPSSPANPLSPMDPSDKLCRLLQLGADLLDFVAPNAHHPAVKQAVFLRKIRDAGISGRRGVISAPGSPRLGPVIGSLPIHATSALGAATGAGLGSVGSGASAFGSPSMNPFEPSPAQSPRNVEDPFSALLSGVSPSVFEGESGRSFFGMEMANLDWDGMFDVGTAAGDQGGSYTF